MLAAADRACLRHAERLQRGARFLAPPQYIGPPQPQHAVTNRAFQGIPSMAVSPRGRLWANWYAGKTPGEDQNNYVVLTTSGDGGATWREVLVVDPDGDGPLRAFDPELWVAPDGKLRVFWAQARGHEATVGGVWCLEIADPEAEQPVWAKPVRVTDGVMMCKPLVLEGEWVLPGFHVAEDRPSARPTRTASRFAKRLPAQHWPRKANGGPAGRRRNALHRPQLRAR